MPTVKLRTIIIIILLTDGPEIMLPTARKKKKNQVAHALSFFKLKRKYSKRVVTSDLSQWVYSKKHGGFVTLGRAIMYFMSLM